MKLADHKFPELLAPAGDLKRLQTALIYGADAVYIGGGSLNLRGKSRGVSWKELEQGLQLARARNRKVYFCLNLLPQDQQMNLVSAYLERLSRLYVDGLIVADPGVLALARQMTPHLPLHLSTQANTGNTAAVRFWKDQGVARINLARELNLTAIRSIRRSVPDMELETFVHGAMCMALSGRCLLSAYLNRRSANQGFCTHPCRFEYRPLSLILEEKTRAGALWEVCEGEEGFSEVLAAEDLCLVKYLAWFVQQGVTALKIEGRMKTSSYLAVVTDVYATALRDLRDKTFRPALYLEELGRAASRPLGTGFFLPGSRKHLFSPGEGKSETPIVAQLEQQQEGRRWKVRVKQRWSVSDTLEILVPGLQRPLIHPGDYGLEKNNGQSILEIHSGQTVNLRCHHPQLASGFMLRRVAHLPPDLA